MPVDSLVMLTVATALPVIATLHTLGLVGLEVGNFHNGIL
jgi:hypothetical protein